MSTWVVEGQSSDFSQHIAGIILALFDNGTNWTETTVGRSNITFGSGAYTNYGDFAIDVRPLKAIPKADVLGSKSYEFEDSVKVHIYARNGTANTLHPSIYAMKSQIEKICAQKATSAGEGIRYIGVPEWDYMDSDDNWQTTWHEAGTIRITYRKVNSA